MATKTGKSAIKITKTYVENLQAPSTGQAFIRDAVLKGFGVRITAGGTIAFIVEKRINGRSSRVKLGRYPELTVEQARQQAQIMLGEIAKGNDPVAEKQAKRFRGITLEETFTDFKRVRTHLSEKTLYDYGRYLERAFPDWKRKPLPEITKDMVARRHRKLTETSGPAYANGAMRILRSVLNFAMAQYEAADGTPVLTENPVTRISRTRAWNRVERRRTVLKRHQLPAWYAAVQRLKAHDQPTDDDGNRLPGPLHLNQPGAVIADFLLLCLFTGLRRNEAATLRWDQVDLLDQTLTLPDPKNHEPLVLPLSDFLMELFEARHAQRRNDFVFPGNGKTGHLIEPREGVAKVVKWSEVDFRPHDLRRTFITVAESLDLSVYAIKRLVNHKMNGDVTAGYIVSDVERLREPMQRITNAIRDYMTHPDSNVLQFDRAAAAEQ